VSLTWKGQALGQAFIRGARRAVDMVLADCVVGAKTAVPVKTATLQGSIQMRPAQEVGGGVEGVWGSFAVKYALHVELGTGPHVIRPVNKRMLYWKGAKHPVYYVNHPGTKARPYLLPQTEKFYPMLSERIRVETEAEAAE
jgi:hypothetical protein